MKHQAKQKQLLHVTSQTKNQEKLHINKCNVARRGVLVITAAQLHSTKPELQFCAGSNPARGVLEIRDGEDL